MYSRDWFKQPAVFRRLMNLWPPFIGAGISIRHISDDWLHVRVQLALRFYNRNYVGTQFGGSLFSMTDPFYMLMLLYHIGGEHFVWDKQSEINFIQPGKGPVYADFRMDHKRITSIVDQAANNEKHYEKFQIDIVDTDGEIVAKVMKTVYIRKKPRR